MSSPPVPVTHDAPAVVRPGTVDDAVHELSAPGAQPLAGGTWVMRSAVRGERLGGTYVSLAGLGELRQVDVGPPLRIGAGVTHAQLGAALDGHDAFGGLRTAARHSANPAVREVASVGGNLCTAAFAAADLVPALLVLNAQVELGVGDRMPIADFLAARDRLLPGTLVTRITAARAPARSAHARLTLRAAGDYPVAIVSVATDERDGRVRIAIGSVEPVARRWHELEAELGVASEPAPAADAARRLAPQLDARDGVEAPGWYRAQVLPALVRRALAGLAGSADT